MCYCNLKLTNNFAYKPTWKVHSYWDSCTLGTVLHQNKAEKPCIVYPFLNNLKIWKSLGRGLFFICLFFVMKFSIIAYFALQNCRNVHFKKYFECFQAFKPDCIEFEQKDVQVDLLLKLVKVKKKERRRGKKKDHPTLL